MAKLLRDRLAPADWSEVEMFLGHRKFDSTSDIYAPFDPSYCANAKRSIEGIVEEIEALTPGAFNLDGEPEGSAPIDCAPDTSTAA
jgi:hypothetical protein